MARKKSLWSELQREREHRQRVAQAQEHANDQTVRQIMRDRDRAERQAARADAWSGNARYSSRTKPVGLRRRP